MVPLDSPYVFFTFLMFNSNIWHNSNFTRYKTLKFQWSWTGLSRVLSRSLKLKCHGTTGLPIYSFLLMFKSNILPNSVHFQDISFEISVTLTLTFKAIQCKIWRWHWALCAFLLMFKSNIWHNWDSWWDIRLHNLSDLEFDLSGHYRSSVLVSQA